MKVRLLLCAMATAWCLIAHAQPFQYRTGAFALGVRSTGNYFLDNQGMAGLGAGGEFKIGFSPRVNSEWFFDYIQSKGEATTYRNDYHIGWSVQFALPKAGFQQRGITPYILGGQCFDLTRAGFYDWISSPLIFSGAAQAGVGLSAFLGKRTELNLQTQYMIHLGKDVHLDPYPENGEYIHIHRGLDFKGHILANLSMNFYLFHLWKG